MISKVIDLDQRRKDVVLDEHLGRLNLDKEMLNEHDAETFQDASKEIMTEYFEKRTDVYNKLANLIAENFSTPSEVLMIGSVLCEHAQTLLSPELEDLGRLFFNANDQAGLDGANREADKWIAIMQEFESFQMSTMKTYLKSSLKDRK